MLLHLPEKWVDRRVRDTFDALELGEVATVRGEVHAYHRPYSERSPHRIQLFDGTGFLTLSFFRADGRWLQGQFPIGAERIVSGRVDDFNGERQMTHPDYIVDPKRGTLPPAVEPIYGLTAGLTNKRVHSFAVKALDHIPGDLPEWIDPHLVTQQRWPGFAAALAGLHAPAAYDPETFALCRERLAYDEALAHESTYALARASRAERTAPAIRSAESAQARLVTSLPYRMTNAQQRCVREIEADIAKASPMRRMLQGDVGAGKTLVAALAAVQAADSGFQVAFMAPTEVLARQQYDTLVKLLAPLGYEVSSLTGRNKGSERESTLIGLADGSIQIIAGTHALFQENVRFKNLGLIIVDEQHRFGVQDRMRLIGKAVSPHMLVMSATPIPRTLAQSIHGDLDVSFLDEKPEGRQSIETRVISDTRLDEIVDAVGRAVERGERVFWVCPRVDQDDDEGASAVGRHAALRTYLNAGIGLVHGRLRPAEKDAALNDFRTGTTQILVATTVIEVGVDVPEATIIVIERAEGFGLAQLHQLRGRVGRGEKPSYCILLYRPPLGELATQRLETLRRTDDGFEIAEADFKLRGPGDLLGVRQSGVTNFRIVDLSRDAELLDIARKDVTSVISKDRSFSSARGKALRLVRELLSPQTKHSKDE